MGRSATCPSSERRGGARRETQWCGRRRSSRRSGDGSGSPIKENRHMSQKVDLYDSAYGNYEADGYRLVRIETYGEDFGQTSWVTTEESNEIPQLLGLRRDSSVLEVGCGSGGYALFLAETIGCRLVGVDINAAGVRNANHLALARGLAERARFEQCDVSTRLPFDDKTFDAVFANDVMCHVPGRPE